MSSDTARHLRAFLEAVGLDFDQDPELERTPGRVEDFFGDVLAGASRPAPQMSTFSNDLGVEQPVLLVALPFHSMCVHHLVPFFGTIDVAYIPGGEMAGFGSFGRVIEYYSHRPQIQERLVAQVADHISEQLEPRGLLVRCRARQMCVEMRTTRKRGVFVSVDGRGALEDGMLREEAMRQFIHGEVEL